MGSGCAPMSTAPLLARAVPGEVVLCAHGRKWHRAGVMLAYSQCGVLSVFRMCVSREKTNKVW